MRDLELKREKIKETLDYTPRFKNKMKKRQWEEKQEAVEKKARNDSDDIPFERIKRKKSIILLGYNGKLYFGMQRNPGMNTIEEELLTAMKKNKWITDEAFNQPQTISFQRAARTDKGKKNGCKGHFCFTQFNIMTFLGVSACMQLVSLKLPEKVDVDALNKDLPEDIRVFCVQRVTKGFNSKDNCDFR